MSSTPQHPDNQGPYTPPNYDQGAAPSQPPSYTPPAYGQQPGTPPPAPSANPYQAAPPAYGAQQQVPSGYGQTPYQVAPQYASFGKRAFGWLFDYLLPAFVISFLAGIIQPTRYDASGLPIVELNWATPLLTLVLYLILSVYAAKTGQTWGRKIAKTQLVGEDGKPIGLGRTFIRYIAHAVDTIILFIGWLFPLWDAKRQTLADKIMKTYVIDVSATGPINVQQ